MMSRRMPLLLADGAQIARCKSCPGSLREVRMHNLSFLTATLAMLGAAFVTPAQSQAPPANSPTVKVGSAVAAKAASPTPGPKAKNQNQQTSIGKGAASVKASAPSAYWTDLVDIDDDGMVEDNQFLFDAKRGMLYTYREDDFKCADGTPQNGQVLMAIYTKGNIAGMPVGSGWYVVALTAGQCGEREPGLFGCKFDANGNLKRCGAAVIHENSGELELVVKK